MALGVLVAGLAAATPAHAAPAPGGPGALSHFDLARKDCVGTAANRGSKVWFTVAGGMLSDVYSPTIDNTNVETLQYVVTDGPTLHRPAEPRHDLQRPLAGPVGDGVRGHGPREERPLLDRHALRDRSGARRGRHVGAVLRRPGPVARRAPGPERERQRRRWRANGGGDDAAASKQALTAIDTNTVTNAANRDYAVPTALALRADRPFTSASAGFAGTASDSLSSPLRQLPRTATSSCTAASTRAMAP